MKDYEYHFEMFDPLQDEYVRKGWFNALGSSGWLLCGVIGHNLIFQREIEPVSINPGENAGD